MGFFDNILQINNSFLLIGLIIVAITCIYLLYTNLTKSNDTTALKTTIMNLIQQNKKRDEIINFLLERIENLEHSLPGPGVDNGDLAQQSTASIVSTVSPAESNDTPADSNDLDNLLDSIVQGDVTNVEHGNTADEPIIEEQNTELDELLNDEVVENNQGFISTVDTGILSQSPGTDSSQNNGVPEQQIIPDELTINDSHAPDMPGDFDDLETEFSGLMDNIVPVQVNIEGSQLDMDCDLVSSILGADDIANLADVEIDLSSIPKDKKKLISKYTTKQLKQIASKLTIKTSGSKVELAERISAKLTDPASGINSA